MSDGEVGLQLRGVALRVGDRDLLEPVDLVVAPGRILAVTGPAGSGTTTALLTLAGVRPPHAGQVLFDGAPIPTGLAGVVTQQHELIGGLSAAENVAVRLLGLRNSAQFDDPEWSGIEALLASLLLPESSWHNLLEQLSGGQQQRVAVARALVGQPPLLCLDDPTSELDAASGEAVWSAIRAAADAGAVVVLVTSDAALLPRCDDVLQLGPPRLGRHRAAGV